MSVGPIWMIAAEASPLAQVGGLGDMLQGLPAALAQRGLRVRRFLPAYGSVSRRGFVADGPPIAIRCGADTLRVRAWSRREAEGFHTTLVRCDPVFGRPGIYGDQGRDYEDNARRFGVLARAVCALATRVPEPPAVLHAHDWHAGAVPLLASLGRAGEPRPRTVFTVHNLPYLGLFPPREALSCLELRESERARVLEPVRGAEFHGAFCFAKAGLLHADRITTVSPTHAAELRTEAQGAGLDGLLRERDSDLVGILNGLDYEEWDPARDPSLPLGYDADTASAGKRAARLVLRREVGLPDAERPIAAVLSRLVLQKGIDLVLDALPELLARDLDVVVLGEGDPALHARLAHAKERAPDRIGLALVRDHGLARRLLGGSDLLLMPSRYEPCGLTQMQAMRYGTIVVAHDVGGLHDTVRDADADATGFRFTPATAPALVRAVDRALGVRARRDAWHAMRTRAMRQRFSWSTAAERYAQLYDGLVAGGR